MTQVYLSFGSNIDRKHNIASGLTAVANTLGDIVLSPVYESEAVGFNGAPFLNLVVQVNTNWPVGDLADFFHRIEADHGRVRGEKKYASRTLDIDILIYGDVVGCVDGVQLPRDEIVEHAFVLKPLCDLAGDQCHPVLKQPYEHILSRADFSSQPLWQVPFDWDASAES